MKIAQFIDTLGVGGAETMLARLCLSLKANGEEIVVFHFGNEYLSNFCKINNIKNIVIPFKRYYNSILTVQLFSLKFAILLKKESIDVLHTHLYGPITSTLPGIFLKKIPHVGTLHDVYLVQQRVGRGLLLRLSQLFGTKLVAVSNDMQNFYSGYIPFSKKILTIHNGFDAEQISPNALTPLSKFCTGSEIKLTTVGRLIPLKRQLEQVKILSAILIKYNAKLFLVGDGSEIDTIRTLIEESNLSKNVFLLGERSDVSSILSDSDIFILASSSEGLSCSILEAMSASLPCIVSDVGGNTELIKHGENGYVFSLSDNEQFINQVETLLQNEQLRKKMGRCGKNIAKQCFSIELMTELYLDAYKDIITK